MADPEGIQGVHLNPLWDQIISFSCSIPFNLIFNMITFKKKCFDPNPGAERVIKSVCLCPRFIAPSSLLMISCTNCTNEVSQDLRLWNPSWQSASMLSKDKCLFMLLTNICSQVLQQMQVRDNSLKFTTSYFSPFSKTGDTFACCQSSGTLPWAEDSF